MRKILSVARSEYRNAVQSKAFIIGVVLMPVFCGGAIAVQTFLKDKVDVTDRKVAVVDRTGNLFETISAAADQRNQYEIFDQEDSAKQIQPRYVLELVQEAESDERVDLTLSNRVRDGDLFAFLIIGPKAFDADPQEDGRISYYTQTPTFRDLPRWLDRVVNSRIKRERFSTAGIDRELVDRLNRSVPVERLGLVAVSQDGTVEEAKRENRLATFGIPAGAMFLLFMLVMMSAPAMLNAVLEEKMQKIAEVLISSVTPFQLMMGKLLATVFVSSTLSLIYVGGVFVLLNHFEALDLLNVSIVLWFFVFQLLALLMFGSIFVAIGSVCSEIRDAQSLMMPAMLLVMIPLFCWVVVLQSPSSTFSRVISLFPPATPLLMLLRIAIPPGPPVWEICLGLVLTTGFALLCVAVGGKIFRIGILSQGQTPTLAKLVQWAFSK